MTADMMFGVRDLLTLLAFGGGMLTVYVGMRTQMTKLETKVEMLITEIQKMDASKEKHAEDFTDMREQIAKLWTANATLVEQVRSLNAVIDWLRSKMSTSNMQALGGRKTRGDG